MHTVPDKDYLVKNYMDHNAHTIPDTANLHDVVNKLLKERISGAPVVNSRNHLVGYVSEQDLVSELVNDAFYCDEIASVTKVMTTEVVTMSPDACILDVTDKITQSHHSNFPVVIGERLVGQITRRDLLRALVEANKLSNSMAGKK